MIRIAAVNLPKESSQYPSCSARNDGTFEVTHVVGEAEIPGARHLQSIDEVCRGLAEFDACVIHAPLTEDFQQLTDLANAGKHILLVEPHQDIESLDQLSEACRKSEVQLVVSQPRRFTSYARAIHEAVQSDCLGSPGLVRIHRWEENAAGLSTQARLWNVSLQEVDLACWLQGSVPTTVFGQSIVSDGQTIGMLIHLGFNNGMAIVDCAFHQGRSFYNASLIGSHGAAYADDHHNTNLLLKNGTAQGMNVTSDEDCLRLQLESFVSSIESRTSNQAVADLKLAIAVCHAAVQSADSHQVARRIGGRYELQ